MINQNILFGLCILKDARFNIVNDLVTEKTDIYHDMFKYENDLNTMNFCIDKYLTIWLDEHWNLVTNFFNEKDVSCSEQKELIGCFTKIFIKLLQSFHFSTSTSNDDYLLSFVLSQKEEYLKNLIEMSSNAEKNINWLIYKKEKSRKLFDRQLNELKNRIL